MNPSKRIFIRGLLMLAFPVILFIPGILAQSSHFDHPGWSKNATIYEVNVRQFTPEGTFAALEKHLPRLQQMGIRILWLMPVQPIGVVNRKGSLGSYYSIRDYLDVNPEFGTKEDFHRLVNTAHDLGMYVILDWVANHTSWDNQLITDHPEWYKKDSTGAIISPVPDWSDVAGLDYSNPGLWQYMTDALLYWIKEFGIDGYRCDVAGMIPVGFWNQAVPELKKVRSVFMLAEWETPDMHDTAFDATYAWDFHHLMNQIARGVRSPLAIDTLYAKERATYPMHAFRMRFTTNHDENSWNGTEFERMGDAAQVFAVLTFTFPGIPLIYTGQESAMTKRLSFFDKDTVPWGDFSLAPFYTALIGLKESTPLLAAGEDGGRFIKVPTSHDHAVYAFGRSNDNGRMLVILNLSETDQHVTVLADDISGTWENGITGIPFTFPPDSTLRLKAWEYRIFCR